MLKRLWRRRRASPADLRRRGGYVSAHNDFEMGGRRMTFWLISFPDPSAPRVWRSFEAEGVDDADALDKIRAAIDASHGR